MEKDLQIVGFRIGRETYGLSIAMVREIIRVPEITAVPNVHEDIEGVINLRGGIVPVIDLPKKLGADHQERNGKNRIVVVEGDGRIVGLIVHSATEVLRMSPSAIEKSHDIFTETGRAYVSGVGKLNGRLVILLDLKTIVNQTKTSNGLEVSRAVTVV